MTGDQLQARLTVRSGEGISIVPNGNGMVSIGNTQPLSHIPKPGK